MTDTGEPARVSGDLQRKLDVLSLIVGRTIGPEGAPDREVSVVITSRIGGRVDGVG